RHRQELDAARDLGHLLVGHRGVTGREVHGAVDEVLDAGAAALALVVDGHALALPAISLEPHRVEREWERRARAWQAQAVLRPSGPTDEHQQSASGQDRDRGTPHSAPPVERSAESGEPITGLSGADRTRPKVTKRLQDR